MSVITHDERDRRSFVLFWMCRLIVKTLLRTVPVTEGLLRRLADLDTWAGRGRRPIGGVDVASAEIAGVPVERITPHALDDPRVGVVYLHGGAFIACGLNTHRPVAAAVARNLRAPVVNVDYRQCPEAGVGTSVHDAYSVYRELRASGDFDSIVVAGDSAGGYLAAKIVDQCARDGVPGPDAYVGFSPLLNLDPGAQRSSRHDAMLPIGRLEKLRPFYERGPHQITGPLDTTGDAVAAAFPPAVIVVAEREALVVDALDLHDALDRAGIVNEIHVHSGQIHAFPAAVPGSTQGRGAIAVAADFVRRTLASAAGDDSGGRADTA